jgi:hypothetical protein
MTLLPAVGSVLLAVSLAPVGFLVMCAPALLYTWACKRFSWTYEPEVAGVLVLEMLVLVMLIFLVLR